MDSDVSAVKNSWIRDFCLDLGSTKANLIAVSSADLECPTDLNLLKVYAKLNGHMQYPAFNDYVAKTRIQGMYHFRASKFFFENERWVKKDKEWISNLLRGIPVNDNKHGVKIFNQLLIDARTELNHILNGLTENGIDNLMIDVVEFVRLYRDNIPIGPEEVRLIFRLRDDDYCKICVYGIVGDVLEIDDLAICGYTLRSTTPYIMSAPVKVVDKILGGKSIVWFKDDPHGEKTNLMPRLCDAVDIVSEYAGKNFDFCIHPVQLYDHLHFHIFSPEPVYVIMGIDTKLTGFQMNICHDLLQTITTMSFNLEFRVKSPFCGLPLPIHLALKQMGRLGYLLVYYVFTLCTGSVSTFMTNSAFVNRGDRGKRQRWADLVEDARAFSRYPVYKVFHSLMEKGLVPMSASIALKRLHDFGDVKDLFNTIAIIEPDFSDISKMTNHQARVIKALFSKNQE